MPETDSHAARLAPVWYVLIAVLLWSTGGLFIKWTTFDAFSVNAGRSFFAALTVAIFTFRKGLRLDAFTVLTSFLYAGTLSLFVYANKTTYAANAIFLQYTAPVYILILAPFVLKEKFRPTDLITVVFCLAGMSFFFFESAGGESRDAAEIFRGNVAGLLSGLFFGLYFIFLRHPRSPRKNPALSVFYGNILVVLLMLPLLSRNPPTEVRLEDFLAIFFLGVFQIGLAYILFTKGMAEGVRPLDASIIGFVEPLLNPIWVFMFLGERPSNWAIFGGFVIIAAVAAHTLVNSLRRKVETD